MAPERQIPAQDRTRISRFAAAPVLVIGICAGTTSHAVAQPYKERQLVQVLRDFQRQGVRVIFSTALVTPDMRVGEEPDGNSPQDIIIAILAPHDLTLRVGPRGVLLVVRMRHGRQAEFH